VDPFEQFIHAAFLGLAQFLSASDKSYDAVVRLGFSTDTADARGRATGSVRQGPFPAREGIDAALDAFRGTFLQQPPAFSAKRTERQFSSPTVWRKRLLCRIGLSCCPSDPLPSPISFKSICRICATSMSGNQIVFWAS